MVLTAACRLAVVCVVLGVPSFAAAQTRILTLEEALKLARETSETVEIARTGEARADATILRARSQRLPQVALSSAYDRTLASEFSTALESTGAPCAPLSVDPLQPLASRVTELERAAGCGAIGPSFNFSDLPFGQRNTYRYQISFSQLVYDGGRSGLDARQASLGRRTAELETTAAEALTMLDVTRAFYDVALAAELLSIAEAGLTQAAAAYDQTKLSFEAGRQPEFELLRAEVARSNQRPLVIRRRADLELARLRLRQLLELPAGTAIDVEADLDAAELTVPGPFAEGLAAAKTTAADRSTTTVRQAETLVSLREAGVDQARLARWPIVSLTSAFGQVGYPTSGFWPGFRDFRTNWNLGAAVQMPLLTGRRTKADELTAQADLRDAKARLQQTRELTELDRAWSEQELTAAEAVWDAGAGAVQQATRAHEIAELRYREGLSTQLELADARLALQVAQANRAQAARDVQVARARLALLPQLPVGVR